MRIHNLFAALCCAQAIAAMAEPVSPAGPVLPSSGGFGPGASASMPSELPVKPLAPPAPFSGPAPKTENGVRSLCGGVGSDEAEWMKREARDYDLMLTFASKSGAYLANVNVGIADARGNSLLKTNCDGPILLVDLPRAGNYSISAETGGHTVTRRAALTEGARARQVTLTWPDAMAGDDTASISATPATPDEK